MFPSGNRKQLCEVFIEHACYVHSIDGISNLLIKSIMNLENTFSDHKY